VENFIQSNYTTFTRNIRGYIRINNEPIFYTAQSIKENERKTGYAEMSGYAWTAMLLKMACTIKVFYCDILNKKTCIPC